MTHIDTDTADRVPCGFGCGYLAASEADLDEHEAQCEGAWAELPAPRPLSTTRPNRR